MLRGKGKGNLPAQNTKPCPLCEDKLIYAKGMCKKCYMAAYRKMKENKITTLEAYIQDEFERRDALKKAPLQRENVFCERIMP